MRYLTQRAGRFHARIVVPERLRNIIGKTELSAPLGADRRQALRKLPAVVASFQDKLGHAERQLRQNKTRRPPKRRSQPIGDREMARQYLGELLTADDDLRASDRRWTLSMFDERHVALLRDVAIGRAHADDIPFHIVRAIEVFRRRGNHDYEAPGPEWRTLARQIALAELEAMKAIALRDEGAPDPILAPMFEATEQTTANLPTTRVRDIFDGYRHELMAAGKGRDADLRWSPIIESLIKFLGHDSARRIKRSDLIRWKDLLLESLSAKTVRDTYISTVRAALNWAVDNDLLESNPAAAVRVRLARKPVSREHGFTDEEALAILRAAHRYQGSRREQAQMTAAKRWSPFLCAFTGARIAEITQLRVEDIKSERGIAFARITPDAGTVKSGHFRDVPLHPQLNALGFLEFVRLQKHGPLFFRDNQRRGRTHPSRVVADRVAKWIRTLGVIDEFVAPNHGWRHRFKTLGRELGVDPRVLDAIQGHAATHVSDRYGDVTLLAKQRAIESLPTYAVNDAVVGSARVS